MAKFLKTAALAFTAPALVATSIPAIAAVPMHAPVAVPAAHDWDNGDGRDDGWNHHDRGRHRDWDDRGYGDRYYGNYNERVRYDEPVYRNTRTWRGDDGRYYCQHRDGTTGLLIGGAAGALVGREVAGRYGDRTLGAILGAVGGALVGRAIDKNSSRCR